MREHEDALMRKKLQLSEEIVSNFSNKLQSHVLMLGAEHSDIELLINLWI